MGVPEISVIVPVYKVEPYLERCVQSVRNQTFRDFELILVDDESPDRCGEMCDAFARQDDRIRVLHKKNDGLSEARNAGMDLARGRYVCFVDSDDFIDPEMLQVLHNLAQKHRAEIAICGVRDCYEGGVYEQDPVEEELVISGVEALGLTLEGKKLPGSVCTKLILRELAQKNRFLKGRTYEDAFYTPQLLLGAKVVAATTRSLYSYWHRADSITTHPFREQNMDVIDAYAYTLEQVMKYCPELEDVARFRLYWAHFVVLDKILLTGRAEEIAQYSQIKAYLKKHWYDVLHCGYFTKERRLGVVALKLHVGLYRILVLWQQKRLEIHG